jgi:hypothetical protein
MSCLAITNQPDTPPFSNSSNTRFGYNSKAAGYQPTQDELDKITGI